MCGPIMHNLQKLPESDMHPSCRTDFTELPNNYVCPQCNAPKKRFLEYDQQTGKVSLAEMDDSMQRFDLYQYLHPNQYPC